MPVLDRLSRLALIPAAPVLFVQSRRLRRNTPILPDAAQPWQGTEPGENPLRLLVLGDSTAAGVGAATQQTALPGNLARALAERWHRGVEWRSIGQSGATARDLVQRYLSEAVQQEYDFVFLTVGANDALGIRSRRDFGKDILTILTALRAASPSATIMMSSLPAFFRFTLLPNPLRRALYRHSRSLEAEARVIVTGFEGAIMSPPPPPYTPGFFASDRFHPSEQGYRDWVHFAIDDAFAIGALL